uniref:Uncharacterized protein n=1 Tax=Manihot esculenta TaxID=3983 RepID=A0A199UA23_MANES
MVEEAESHENLQNSGHCSTVKSYFTLRWRFGVFFPCQTDIFHKETK